MNNVHVEYEDLALYATGGADPSEMARVREHVEQCTNCRSELQQVYGDLGMLAMSAPDAEPSQAVKRRLMASIAKEDVGRREAAHPPAPSLGWAWAALAAAVIFALTSGMLVVRNADLKAKVDEAQQKLVATQTQAAVATKVAATLSAPDALRITMVKAGEKPQPQLQTIYSESHRRVVLVATDLAPLPAGKAYELWVLPQTGAPVAAGVFHADAAGHANHTYEFASQVEAKGFAITVEDDAGVAAPTAKPIFVGLRG